MEIDLSEPATQVPMALRPRLAILDIGAPDGDGRSVEQSAVAEAELRGILGRSEQYGAVLWPSAVQARLGDRAPAARRCSDWVCYEEMARALGVHRAVRLTVERSEAGSRLTLYGYDPGFPAIAAGTREVEGSVRPSRSRALANREFADRIRDFLRISLSKLATPNGKLVVACPDPTAAVSFDGVPVGLGSVELVAQRGPHTVKVASAGAEPFQAQVEIVSLQSTRLGVELTPKPSAPGAVPTRPVPFTRRPGLYVGAGGVALGIVGVILGQLAAGVSSGIERGGDPLAVSRSEAKAGQAEAALANVFVPVGTAAAVGGTIWFLLHPAEPLPTTADPTRVVRGGTE